MAVRILHHAKERAAERGATEAEIIATVEGGEQFPVKYGRVGFRRNFPFEAVWGVNISWQSRWRLMRSKKPVTG
jgi:hypothetical protein